MKKGTVDIILTNTTARLECGGYVIEELREMKKKFKFRVPGAFFSPAYRARRWDGFKRLISEQGYFEAGLIHDVIREVTDLGYKTRIHDSRETILPEVVIDQVQEMELRGYQKEGYDAFFAHKIKKLPFPRGILDQATNAGKNLLSAAIFLSYPENVSFFFIIHNKTIHAQAVKEMTELLGKHEVGVIDSKRFYLKRFNVCMAGTLAARLNNPEVKRALAKADGCVVDECHRAATKQYERILQNLYNCPIRIGLSGTPFMHKDPLKNMKVKEFFGVPIHQVKNKRLIEEGFSTKPIVKVILGETRYAMPGDYKGEYDKVITNNKRRHKLIWKRVARAIDKGRYPLMIFCRYIAHAENLLKSMPPELKKYKVGMVNSGLKNNPATLQKFREGTLDILIATHLIQAGLNLPLIKFSINGGGADSQIVILQWFGRMLRVHKSKKRVYIEDIYDLGKYLKRHSKHRVKFYKGEGFEVIETYKITAKRKSIRII